MGTRRRGTVARTAASGAPWARHGTAPPRPAPPHPGSPPPPRLPAVRSHFSGPAFSVCERLLTLKAVAPGMGFFGGFFFFGLLFFYPDVAADQRYLHVWG